MEESPVLIRSPEHALELLGFTIDTLKDSATQFLKRLDQLDHRSLLYIYLSAEPSEKGKKRRYAEFKQILDLALKCSALETSDDLSIQRLNTIHFLAWLSEIGEKKKIPLTFSKSLAYFISTHFKVPNETPEKPDHRKMSHTHLSRVKLDVPPDDLALSASKVATPASLVTRLTYHAARFLIQPIAVELFTEMMPGVYLAKHPTLTDLDNKILVAHPNIKLFVVANKFGEEKNAFVVRMTTLQDLQDRGIQFVKLGGFKDFSTPHSGSSVYISEERVALIEDMYCAGRRAQIALENSEEVVFHCKKGKGRSAQVYGVFRLAILRDTTIDELWADTKRKRPGVDSIEDKKGKETNTKKAILECTQYINENRDRLEALFQKRYPEDFPRSQAGKVIVIGGDAPPIPSREGREERRSPSMRNSMGSSSE
ncbi:MAG TPA: hypothetical protein VGV92_05235 [Gammaproteobacteria bacterium]|nr:hypothetical protein [Gammaproteobacteria bacterium]